MPADARRSRSNSCATPPIQIARLMPAPTREPYREIGEQGNECLRLAINRFPSGPIPIKWTATVTARHRNVIHRVEEAQMSGYEVTVSALSTAAGTLRGIGGDLGGIDGSGPLASSASAVPGSSLAGAASGLAGELTTAIRDSGAAVRTLGDNAESAGRTYTASDDSAVQRFGGPR
jgi:hypothetical protein